MNASTQHAVTCKPGRTLRINGKVQLATGERLVFVSVTNPTKAGVQVDDYAVTLNARMQTAKWRKVIPTPEGRVFSQPYRCTTAAGMDNGCTCPDFQHRTGKLEGGKCKHIAASLAILSKISVK